uniref:Uncharacterized protein n=1 Tax=Oryza nivara TaxID=4536 RepID=A0A0E0ICS0_ORYNI
MLGEGICARVHHILALTSQLYPLLFLLRRRRRRQIEPALRLRQRPSRSSSTMSHFKSGSRVKCTMLAVLCGKVGKQRTPPGPVPESQRPRPSFPFLELISSGRLDVHTLINPTVDQFLEAQRALQPRFIYLQGQLLDNEEEIGALVWGDADVYLEVPSGEKIAQSLQSKGISYIMYWRYSLSSYAASHFRHSLLSVVQRIYMTPPGSKMAEEEDTSEYFPDIKIYDEDVHLKLLICGAHCTPDSSVLNSVEDGLNALLNIELVSAHNISLCSAAPPLHVDSTLLDGVVTICCDITTSSSSHVSLLLSGSPQTCFDDKLLEKHIKKELIESRRLVRVVSVSEDDGPSSAEPLTSMSVASGASTFEVLMTLPKWAAQVLKYLAQETQGVGPLLFFCTNQDEDEDIENDLYSDLPRWSASLEKDRVKGRIGSKPARQIGYKGSDNVEWGKGGVDAKVGDYSLAHEHYESSSSSSPSRRGRDREKGKRARDISTATALASAAVAISTPSSSSVAAAAATKSSAPCTSAGVLASRKSPFWVDMFLWRVQRLRICGVLCSTMPHFPSGSRVKCTMLAVLCGKVGKQRMPPDPVPESQRPRPSFPFPELISSGRLDVHTLINPTVDQFLEAQRALQPRFMYFQGQQLDKEEEIGRLVWGDADVSDPQIFSSLICPPFPTIVYLEVPSGEKIAQSLQSKGISYIMYWRYSLSSYAASHFRHSLMSVVPSSCSHAWDAFQLAYTSFEQYCVRNNEVQRLMLGPHLLGDAPRIYITPPGNKMAEEEDTSEYFPDIKIYDEDVHLKLLICGAHCTPDSSILNSLEDGLNALLNIEFRWCKLQDRVSAAPPLHVDSTLLDGVVTICCDITTSSSSHVSLLLSGSPQTCFDDKLLEKHIKKELIESRRLVRVVSVSEDDRPSSAEPLTSMSVASGASTFEVLMTLPKWAAQVLKYLAQETSYKSLVPLGIASVNGTPVSSFDRQDVDRLLFFCTNQDEDEAIANGLYHHPPRWSASLAKDRVKGNMVSKPVLYSLSTVNESSPRSSSPSSSSSSSSSPRGEEEAQEGSSRSCGFRFRARLLFDPRTGSGDLSFMNDLLLLVVLQGSMVE